MTGYVSFSLNRAVLWDADLKARLSRVPRLSGAGATDCPSTAFLLTLIPLP
jgi:hypothetical protein